MYELIKVGEKSYYIDCPAKMGLYVDKDNEVYVIDSGNDKNAGRKVRQILDANGWKLKAILNTHSHADHIGGNKYLQSQTNCKIYAPGPECAFTNSPILEPMYLYGGFPPAELKNKFLMAQESIAEPLSADVLPEGLEIISLPGHGFDMVGFKTSDDVYYLADCLSSKATLEKYQVGFLFDAGAYIDTLEYIKTLKAGTFVPAHADVTDDISELAQFNLDKVNEIGDLIVSFCKESLCLEDILKKLFDHYDLTLSIDQYVLVGSTLRSYLTWLKETDRIKYTIEDNRMLWSV